MGEFLECFCHLICGLLIEEAGRFTRLHPQVILLFWCVLLIVCLGGVAKLSKILDHVGQEYSYQV